MLFFSLKKSNRCQQYTLTFCKMVFKSLLYYLLLLLLLFLSVCPFSGVETANQKIYINIIYIKPKYSGCRQLVFLSLCVAVSRRGKGTFLSVHSIWRTHSEEEKQAGEESEGKKQRFSSNEYLAGVLPESWLVCSSINSSILYPSNSLREDVAAAWGDSQGQLIGSSWLDPRSFSTS